jgi:hypothetical protein
MAVTIRQTESMPAAYPDPPEVMTAAALALDLDLIWQRIEAYIAHRWAERDVVFIAEGPGEWEPPLFPVTITTAEVWRGEAWHELTLPESPMGGYLLAGHGPYRFTGTAGDDEADVPAVVMEAFKRLAEYSAQSKGKAGARHERIGAGSISLSHTRHEAWLGRAMMNSGAGDLLRPYRRAR